VNDPVIAAVALRDSDDDVLALAALVAGVIGAPLALVHAYPVQQLVPLPPPAWAERTRERAEAALRMLAERLPAELEARTLAKANPAPVRALHETAEELGASLLVTGSSHRGATGRVVPGGIGERLLHASPCPVAIAPRGYRAPGAGLMRIGVAYAAGPEGAGALRLAGRLAAAAGTVVTTYTVTDGGRVAVERVLERVRETVPADRLGDRIVLHGDPAEALAAVSASLDLLITGSRGYGPVRSLLVGGVSQELAHSASCPLLVVANARRE
jgi:nucleotide-binding universal stress UspA family protein